MASLPRRNNFPHSMAREYWDYWDHHPSTLYMQNFGSLLDFDRNKDNFMSSSSPFDSSLRRERREFISRSTMHRHESTMSTSGSSSVKNDANQFQILLDVSQFRAEEIDVKTVDHEVIIHAKHAEREDEHGLISREFTRRYMLPVGVDPLQVTALYDSKGILAIKAIKEVSEKSGRETLIKVEKEPQISTATTAPGDNNSPGQSGGNGGNNINNNSNSNINSNSNSNIFINSKYHPRVSSEKVKKEPAGASSASSTRKDGEPCSSSAPREDFFKSGTETSKDFFRTCEPSKEYFKTSIDPTKRYFESKSTYSSSSSSLQRTSVTTNGKLTGAKPKQLVTDV